MIYNKKFYGELNGYTLGDMYSCIDYKDTLLEDRIGNAQKAIDTGFFQEYFDDVYDPHPNKNDPLSDGDSVCQCLEKMADYILGSDEELARKAAKKEYIYFNDRNSLRKKLNKELNFSNILSNSPTFSDIILNNIMHDSVGRIALPKEIDITKEDLEGDDPCSKCLQGYQGFIEELQDMIRQGKGNRFRLSKQIYHLKQDMITVKKCFTGVYNYKHDNINRLLEHNRDFDLADRDIVYGHSINCQGKNRFIQGLIFYERPEGLDVNNPLSLALYDIEQALDGMLTQREERMLYLLRKGVPRKEIARILHIDESTISRDIQKIVDIIIENNLEG